MADDGPRRLLALLGLAHRAGRLALGATAVAALVERGRRPLVVVARDCGRTQQARLRRLAPVRGLLSTTLCRQELAQALGRRQLSVVALDDPHFVVGIERLGLSWDPGRRSADGTGEGRGQRARESKDLAVGHPSHERGRR